MAWSDILDINGVFDGISNYKEVSVVANGYKRMLKFFALLEEMSVSIELSVSELK